MIQTESVLKRTKKIDEIFGFLLNEAMSKHYSILNGEMGKALFMVNYFHFKKDQRALNKFLDIIKTISSNLQSFVNPMIGSLSMGITGFGWLLAHVEKHGLADIKATKLLKQLDEVILSKSLEMLNEGNYDYLHGGLGGGMYFLNRGNNKKNHLILSKILNDLETKAVEFGNNMAWKNCDLITKKLKNDYNLGLSHGIPSILMFLIGCYEIDLEKERTKQLIEKTANFLFSSSQDSSLGSYYGVKIDTSDPSVRPSRLSWCYGDLGVIYSLLRANNILKRTDISRFTSEVLDFQFKRTEPKKELVLDAGFCHGASGVAHMFHKIYELTSNKECQKIANYWIDVTMSMDTFKDAPVGYKSYQYNRDPLWKHDSGLIEGVPGIGLALMSSVSSVKVFWDELFLLN